MPAKLLKRAKDEGSFSRIYNTGVDNKNIFNDSGDYGVFLGFLSEYLTTPKSIEEKKQVFTVKGRTFHGVPHQPKNYLGEVELMAYRLLPDRFDLILKQLKRGALEKFMRSLSTRYSIYLNKRYKKKGIVFAGPYKSEEIKDSCELLSLSRLLHRSATYSSFEDYIGERNSTWVNPETILNCFEKKKAKELKEFSNYRDFVEKEEPYQNLPEEVEVVSPIPAYNFVPKVPEFATLTALFLILLGLGLRNITVTEASNKKYLASSNVLSETTSQETQGPTFTTNIIVKTPTGIDEINIREKPSTSSAIIGKAKNGQTFKSNPVNSEWNEIQLENGSIGFISSKYIEIYNTKQ